MTKFDQPTKLAPATRRRRLACGARDDGKIARPNELNCAGPQSTSALSRRRRRRQNPSESARVCARPRVSLSIEPANVIIVFPSRPPARALLKAGERRAGKFAAKVRREAKDRVQLARSVWFARRSFSQPAGNSMEVGQVSVSASDTTGARSARLRRRTHARGRARSLTHAQTDGRTGGR